MKARISLEKSNRKRTIILRDNSLLIVFHDNFEADNAYRHLKNEMKRDGWAPLTLKQFVKNDVKNAQVKKSRIFGLLIKEKII